MNDRRTKRREEKRKEKKRKEKKTEPTRSAAAAVAAIGRQARQAARPTSCDGRTSCATMSRRQRHWPPSMLHSSCHLSLTSGSGETQSSCFRASRISFRSWRGHLQLTCRPAELRVSITATRLSSVSFDSFFFSFIRSLGPLMAQLALG